MTPQLATRLTLHDDAVVAPASARGLVIPFPGGLARVARDGHRVASAVQRRETHHRRLLGAFDLAAATVAFVAVLALMTREEPGLLALAGMPLVVLPFKLAGLYDRDQLRIAHSTLDEAPQLLQLTGLYALILTVLAPVMLRDDLPPRVTAALWLATFVTVAGGRVAARSLAGRTMAPERCLVVGDPARAMRIRAKLRSSRARAVVVASLPPDGDVLEPLDAEGIRHLVAELGLHRIIVAPATTDSAAVVELIRSAKAAGAQVSVLPRMLEAVGSSVEFEDLDGMTVLGVRPFGLSRSSRLLKRAFDLVATSIGLIALTPVIAVIVVAIRIDSPGAVLFRQVRVGRDGRHFRIFKFRSMVVGAESRRDELRGLNEVGEGMFKVTADPRVTRVGGLLRRTSLDELPQLLNVLRGEMSLVGPRPLVVDEDARISGLDRSRLHLTPGMTGPWQVLGARVPMQEMLGIDYLYVAGWSLWQDVKILVRTVVHVFRGGNV